MFEKFKMRIVEHGATCTAMRNCVASGIEAYAALGISDVMPSDELCRRGAPMLLMGAPFIDERSA